MVSNIEKVFDAVSVGSGATETRTVTIDRADQEIAFYIKADSNGTNLDIGFDVDPDDDKVNMFFDEAGNDVTGQDATGGIVLRPTIQPADQVEVTITNQGASASVVDVWAKPYKP